MKIIEKTYSFGYMDKRNKTTRIILHHAAAEKCSADDIHRWHKGRGWAGIGYHFFVRKDGSVYRGRPQNTVGAHAGGANSDSIGICFEGNYEKEKTMPAAQKQAGAELVAYIKKHYGISKVQGHSDVGSTACPGRHFPFDEIANGVIDAAKEEPATEYSREQFIREVQAAIGAEVDGIAGKETKDKAPLITMITNRRHAAVEPMQKRLIALGYDVGDDGADGKYGKNTAAAVVRFQKDAGCTWIDGKVGDETWAALFKA